MVNVFYRPFPAACGGTVHGLVSSSRGRITILIDSSQDEQTQRKALRHELAHVVLGHLEDTTRSTSQIEAEAEDLAARMTDEEMEKILKKNQF